MKKRYALISVLLLVAFMWSCQAEKSSPFAPEDMTTLAANSGNATATVTAKGGKGKVKDTATYMIEVFFEGSSVPAGTSDPVSFGNPNCLRDDHMLLDVAVLNSLDCFTGLTIEVGIFQIFGDSIGFWFDANGCTRKNYIMWMPIVSVEGTWPPANVDEFTTFTGSELNITFNKKKCNNACEGTVPIDWTIVVTKIS
ncbi:MAG: hypothetical protein KJ874_09530 [Acidobacteria bacterium]|nr:hypothetical protein [Acidobacteriota bacterium]